jgi:hypothetical protein
MYPNTSFFLQQDIALAWNKRRNEGKYPEVPKIEQVLSYPTPWSDDLVKNFAAYINGRLCIPKQLRGNLFFFKRLLEQPIFWLSVLRCLLFLFCVALFLNDDAMEYSKDLLNKEADFHGLLIKPSKFKNAGMGLFAAKGSFIICNCRKRSNLTHFLFPFTFLLQDLPKGTLIPYFGVLQLQDVASEDSVDPLQLPEQLSNLWDRVVVLGNQPIVREEGKAVRL